MALLLDFALGIAGITAVIALLIVTVYLADYLLWGGFASAILAVVFLLGMSLAAVIKGTGHWEPPTWLGIWGLTSVGAVLFGAIWQEDDPL